MERMPFNTAKLPKPTRKYAVYLHDLWLGESEATTPDRAITNVCWVHGLYRILTRSELDELYAREVA